MGQPCRTRHPCTTLSESTTTTRLSSVVRATKQSPQWRNCKAWTVCVWNLGWNVETPRLCFFNIIRIGITFLLFLPFVFFSPTMVHNTTRRHAGRLRRRRMPVRTIRRRGGVNFETVKNSVGYFLEAPEYVLRNIRDSFHEFDLDKFKKIVFSFLKYPKNMTDKISENINQIYEFVMMSHMREGCMVMFKREDEDTYGKIQSCNGNTCTIQFGENKQINLDKDKLTRVSVICRVTKTIQALKSEMFQTLVGNQGDNEHTDDDTDGNDDDTDGNDDDTDGNDDDDDTDGKEESKGESEGESDEPKMSLSGQAALKRLQEQHNSGGGDVFIIKAFKTAYLKMYGIIIGDAMEAPSTTSSDDVSPTKQQRTSSSSRRSSSGVSKLNEVLQGAEKGEKAVEQSFDACIERLVEKENNSQIEVKKASTCIRKLRANKNFYASVQRELAKLQKTHFSNVANTHRKFHGRITHLKTRYLKASQRMLPPDFGDKQAIREIVTLTIRDEDDQFGDKVYELDTEGYKCEITEIDFMVFFLSMTKDVNAANEYLNTKKMKAPTVLKELKDHESRRNALESHLNSYVDKYQTPDLKVHPQDVRDFFKLIEKAVVDDIDQIREYNRQLKSSFTWDRAWSPIRYVEKKIHKVMGTRRVSHITYNTRKSARERTLRKRDALLEDKMPLWLSYYIAYLRQYKDPENKSQDLKSLTDDVYDTLKTRIATFLNLDEKQFFWGDMTTEP